MNFHALSISALKCLERFEEVQYNREDGGGRAVLEKIKRTGYDVWLMACDEPGIGNDQQSAIDEEILLALANAWKSICCAPTGQPDIRKKSWRKINSLSKCLPIPQKPGQQPIRYFLKFKDKDHLLILLTGDEPYGLPDYGLFLLSYYWQIKQGFFPLHACGVQHNGHLFIFSGPSGAGKSTVADLSRSLGNQVTDEDQVLVHPQLSCGYSADGWGYRVVPCETPLRAIFYLVQDIEDKIIPLSQVQVARLMLERQNDILRGLLNDDLLKISFHSASEIARQVPGYELHFRNSPDFWKLIDERFPG